MVKYKLKLTENFQFLTVKYHPDASYQNFNVAADEHALLLRPLELIPLHFKDEVNFKTS